MTAPAQPRPPGPLRWGFLGAGRIAWTLAGNLTAARGATLTAIAAGDVSRADALGEAVAGLTGQPAPTSYGGASRADAYTALLADPEVDAVYISLPPSEHLRWTLAALAAGRHVLCEKPLALGPGEVDAMAVAADEAGRRVVEASMWHWHPRTRLAARLLAEGAIGQVRHVSAGFAWGSAAPGDFRLDPALGGGALLDVGCYAVSAALWAGGDLVDVTGRVTTGPTGVDLAADGVLELVGGAQAQVHAGIDEAAAQWLVVTGDAGELELRPYPFTATTGVDSEVWLSDGRGTERIPVPPADPYRAMLEQVGDLFAGDPGAPDVLPLAASRATAAAMTALRASAARSGEPVAPA